jgi:hypothetical protein
MKHDIPNFVVYGAIAAVVVIVAAIGFFALRDKAPTKDVNPIGRDKLTGPPAPTGPPAWAMEKFKAPHP